MSKYAFVFPVTKQYLHEARPLVKSLFKWHPDIPIYITTIDTEYAVSEEDFSDLAKVEVVIAPECDTGFRQVRTYRFKFAMELKDKHQVVMLLDADMCLIRPIEKFFRIAETGVMVGCSDSTILYYNEEHFSEYNIEPDEKAKNGITHPFFSTVPLFVNPSDERTYEFLKLVWENPSGNDLEVPNRIVAATGRHDEMMLLNSYQWTNIHHSMLKPETFAKMTPDGLISYQGQHIYMIHGHWRDENYLKHDLIDPMERNYGWDKKNVDRARNAVNDIKKVYDEYLC